MASILFTPAAVLDLLTQIRELEDYEISLIQSDDKVGIKIGKSNYRIEGSDILDIKVSKSDESNIDEVNDSTLQSMEDSGDIDLEPVESGILKQLAKTLLVGGLVRLSAKLLK